MPRINPIDPAAATGDAAAHIETSRRMFGTTLNHVTTAAHSPAVVGALLAMVANLSKSSLGAKTGELIAIGVAEANGCEYCLSAHTAIGTSLGLTPVALEAARVGKSTEAKTAGVLKLATAINESRGRIDDATLAAARLAGLTDAEIVEVVGLVALNVFTNYLNNVAKTALDFPEVPASAAA